MDLLDRVDLSKVAEIPISDLDPVTLAAMMKQRFPRDPIGHLKILRTNKEIGSVLYNRAEVILMGDGYDKRKRTYNEVSFENSSRGLIYKSRTGNS